MTCSGIHLIVRHATCGWTCQGTIEIFYDSIQKRLNIKATRPSWQNILLTKSFSVPLQTELSWCFLWHLADLCWEAFSPSTFQPCFFSSSGLTVEGLHYDMKHFSISCFQPFRASICWWVSRRGGSSESHSSSCSCILVSWNNLMLVLVSSQYVSTLSPYLHTLASR